MTSNDEIDPRDETWRMLGDLPVPPPPPDARERFDALVEREARSATRGAGRTRLAIAAGFLLAALIGFGAGTWRSRPATPVGETYLLLLYDPQAANVAPDQERAIVAEYAAWARGLRDAGKLVTAEKLADDPELQLGAPPATRNGERIGGFFLIRAHDFAEASRIAADCPHIKHGGRVELRAIQPT